MTDPARYQRTTYGDRGWVEHLDGVEWFMCDAPPFFHRCWAQSRWHDTCRSEVEERCACGGVRLDGRRPWIQRNTHTTPTATEREQYARDAHQDALIREFGTAAPERQAQIRDEIRQILDAGEAQQ